MLREIGFEDPKRGLAMRIEWSRILCWIRIPHTAYASAVARNSFHCHRISEGRFSVEMQPRNQALISS
jgi:hypothetical protein